MIEGGVQAFSLEAVEVIEAISPLKSVATLWPFGLRAQSLGSIKASPLWYGTDSKMARSKSP